MQTASCPWLDVTWRHASVLTVSLCFLIPFPTFSRSESAAEWGGGTDTWLKAPRWGLRPLGAEPGRGGGEVKIRERVGGTLARSKGEEGRPSPTPFTAPAGALAGARP